jgi:hypothetical protein
VSPVLVSHERSPAFDEDHSVPDQLGELATRYEIGDGDARAILIRPDMYVGAHCRLEDAAALVDYVEQWLTPGARSRVGSR